MKGIIGKVIATLGWAGALAGVGGCFHYSDVVDPCYPERYWYASRQSVQAAFAPQVQNGHVLDQTVWNYHFEDGSDRLTPGGMEHLNYLARRRPVADPMIYLQTAHDLLYNPDKDDYATKRFELDQKRAASIKKYLTAYAAGGNAPPFEVQVHNAPDVGIGAIPAEASIRLMYTTPRATLPGTGGTSTSGGGGASSGGGGR